MNTTETYGLNQWESSDRILMNDFNSDNQKLESALKALAGDIAQRATQAALEAARQEASAAVTAARQDASSALAAAVAAAPFKKLGTIVPNSQVRQIDVDLSGIRLTDYDEIIVYPQLLTASSTIAIRFNGIDDRYDHSISGQSGISLLTYLSSSVLSLHILGSDSVISTWFAVTSQAGTNGYIGTACLKPEKLLPSAFTTLNFISYDVGSTFSAGGKITIYGVKA